MCENRVFSGERMSSVPLCRFLCTNLFVYVYIVFSLNIFILMVILCATVFPYWHFPAGILPGLGCVWTEGSVATRECRAYGFHLLCQSPWGIWHPVGSEQRILYLESTYWIPLHLSNEWLYVTPTVEMFTVLCGTDKFRDNERLYFHRCNETEIWKNELSRTSSLSYA